MIELKFNGPIHFDDLNIKTGELKTNAHNYPHPNQPGIYIWGFMYEYNKSNKSLGNPINGGKQEYNEDTMQFIPYYVGLASGKGKSPMTISKRLITHNNIRIGVANKYIRFSESFLKEFFKDGNGFPINTNSKSQANGISKLVFQDSPDSDAIKNDKVIYFNSHSILKHIYPNKTPVCDKDNYPISKQGLDEDDTLSKIIFKKGKDNFWFCYAIQPAMTKLSDLEVLTFYSLKGKTISKTHSCPKETVAEIQGCIDTRIFKNGPSNKFPGYLEELSY